MLAVRILGRAVEEKRDEDESAPSFSGPGKLGRSGAAPVQEEEATDEVAANVLSDMKFEAGE